MAAGLAVLTAAALVHLAGARTWPLELVHHFIPQYLLATAGLAVLALVTRHWRQAAFAALLASVFAVVCLSAPISGPATVSAGVGPGTGVAHAAAVGSDQAQRSSFTLITNNVYVLNGRRDELLAWLASRPADVVTLQEVNGPLTRQLRQGEDGYPYRLIGEDPFVSRGGWLTRESIVVLSRFPIVEHRFLRPAARAWQAALVRLEMPDGSRPWLVAIHPPSPLYAENLPARDAIFHRLAEEIAGLDDPVVVAGDFNASPYTPVFNGFIKHAGLATFRSFPPTYSRRFGRLGISIDHVLVRGAQLTDLRALRPIGSDHRPLTATIGLFADGRSVGRRPSCPCEVAGNWSGPPRNATKAWSNADGGCSDDRSLPRH